MIEDPKSLITNRGITIESNEFHTVEIMKQTTDFPLLSLRIISKFSLPKGSTLELSDVSVVMHYIQNKLSSPFAVQNETNQYKVNKTSWKNLGENDFQLDQGQTLFERCQDGELKISIAFTVILGKNCQKVE